MKHKTYLGGWWFIFSLILIGPVLLAGLPLSPVRADSTLPPRDTPTPQPDGDDKDRDGPPVGAHLELVALNVPAGVWIVVQWQDSAGGWHDVEGWRGSVANSSRWWVHPKDFSTGPFRWVVKQGADGSMVGASAPFRLPGEANQVVQVKIGSLSLN